MNFLKPKFWNSNKFSITPYLLIPLTFFWQLIFFLKRIFTKENKVQTFVICVGNIYIGGTGKTPLSLKLFSLLKKNNKNCAFIRKKYTKYQDEIEFLKLKGPTYERSRRVDAINDAIKDKLDIVIMDDGFQDFSIKKNISIVCFHEKQWLGNGLTIPSGPLRENLSGLKRANYVFINGKKNEYNESMLLKKNQSLKIFYYNYRPTNIKVFENKKVVCFAGIGNPSNFFNLLKKNNIDVIEEISFPDHYNFSEEDLKMLDQKAKTLEAILLTTEKDYLRLNDSYKEKINYLNIEVEIENEDHFIKEIIKIYENN